MADGFIAMDVMFADGGIVKCRVTEGGVLRDHKGVAFPGIQIDVPTVTEKDTRTSSSAKSLASTTSPPPL